MPKCQALISHVCASSHCLRVTFFILKVGQEHQLELSQWYHSLANIKISKSYSVHFCASSHSFRDIRPKNLNFTFKEQVKVAEYNFCNDTIRWQKYENLQTNPIHFLLSLITFQRCKNIKILTYKIRSRSRSRIFAMTQLDSKCQNLPTTPSQLCQLLPFQKNITIKKLLPSKIKSR